MKLCFEKKVLFKILWYIDLCTCLVKDYDIWYGTRCFDIDRIYALSLTMFQWAPPMGIIRWYFVDPASGGCALVFVDPVSGGCALVFLDPASRGCALVFCGPRQWGLNVGHSRGCWVTSVLKSNRIYDYIICEYLKLLDLH